MSTFTVSKVCVMTYKKGSCAESGPVDVFQFKSDSVKPFSSNNNNANNNLMVIITVIIH